VLPFTTDTIIISEQVIISETVEYTTAFDTTFTILLW